MKLDPTILVFALVFLDLFLFGRARLSAVWWLYIFGAMALLVAQRYEAPVLAVAQHTIMPAWGRFRTRRARQTGDDLEATA